MKHRYINGEGVEVFTVTVEMTDFSGYTRQERDYKLNGAKDQRSAKENRHGQAKIRGTDKIGMRQNDRAFKLGLETGPDDNKDQDQLNI